MSKNVSKKDNIDLFLDDDLNYKDRIIYMGTPVPRGEDSHSVTAFTASHLIKSLILLEKESHENITIILNTMGGDFFACLAIYDFLKSCNSQITIIGTGAIMSSGSVILQAATAGCRLLTKHATVLIHDGSDGFSGNARDFEKWGENSKRMRDVMYRIFAENCGEAGIGSHKADWWRKKCKDDWIMNSEEAVKNGVADSIITRLPF